MPGELSGCRNMILIRNSACPIIILTQMLCQVHLIRNNCGHCRNDEEKNIERSTGAVCTTGVVDYDWQSAEDIESGTHLLKSYWAN